MAYRAFKDFVKKFSNFDERDGTWSSWKEFNQWDLEQMVRSCIREHTSFTSPPPRKSGGLTFGSNFSNH